MNTAREEKLGPGGRSRKAEGRKQKAEGLLPTAYCLRVLRRRFFPAHLSYQSKGIPVCEHLSDFPPMDLQDADSIQLDGLTGRRCPKEFALVCAG